MMGGEITPSNENGEGGEDEEDGSEEGAAGGSDDMDEDPAAALAALAGGANADNGATAAGDAEAAAAMTALTAAVSGGVEGDGAASVKAEPEVEDVSSKGRGGKKGKARRGGAKTQVADGAKVEPAAEAQPGAVHAQGYSPGCRAWLPTPARANAAVPVGRAVRSPGVWLLCTNQRSPGRR